MADLEHSISLDDAELLFRGRMGLIFGSGITFSGPSLLALKQAVLSKWGGDDSQNILQLGQHAVEGGASAGEVREVIREVLAQQVTSPNLKRIANLKWSAALSFTLDSNFEKEFSRACQRRIPTFTVTKVSKLANVLPTKTIPIFKLLGAAEDPDFVFNELGYIGRRPNWRYAVQGFSDKIKDSTVVCFGLQECQWLFLDLLSQILSDPKSVPTSMLFVASEFSPAQRASIIELTHSRMQIGFVEAPWLDVLNRMKSFDESGSTPPLAFKKAPLTLDRLLQFQDIVAIVNLHTTSEIAKDERARLLDLLFSPNIPRWDAFVHQLDFRRTFAATILDALLRSMRAGRTLPAYAIVGSAACGKTTLAKRVALDLAERGHLVFWFRKSFYPNVQNLLAEFFKALSEVSDKKKRIYFFVDDPLGLGSLSIQAIAANAQSHGIRCTFVVAARTSDWKIHQPHQITGSLDLVQDFALSDQLDSQEMQALPNYLVKLGIYADKEQANRDIAATSNRSTADILGILFYLLPRTRESIQLSIQDEYMRLGESGGLSRIVIGAYNKTTEFLRKGYAMAAVGDRYHTPVPVEILVSALDIPYRDWMQAVGTDTDAWGLLYAEPTADEGTIAYRPRNAVITRILVDTVINGGKLAHSGEVEQLATLLRACNGTSPIYREFCVNILVPRSKLSHLDYQDGLLLYDAAISALPVDDRTLKHQKGLWIKAKGNDPLLAIEVLQNALLAKPFPYAERSEADEHIHTSLAAAMLDAAEKGEIDLEDGLPEILQHLDKARSNSFFNANAVHVHATLMLRLISRIHNREAADTYNLLNDALVAVDDALLMLRNPLSQGRDQSNKDVEMLEDVSGRIYEKVLPLDELEVSATELWAKFKRQDGFVIAGRKLYHLARSKDSGTSYNEAFQYCNGAIKIVQGDGQALSPALASVTICIYYDWNVRRYEKNAGRRVVDWKLLVDLSRVVLQSSTFSADPFYKFVLAVALAQQNKWTDANQIFAQIRKAGIPNEQLYEVRAVLLDEEGVRRPRQGMITGDEGKQYFKADDLHSDFYLSREERWPNPGETAHAFITFSLAGPLAVQSP